MSRCNQVSGSETNGSRIGTLWEEVRFAATWQDDVILAGMLERLAATFNCWTHVHTTSASESSREIGPMKTRKL